MNDTLSDMLTRIRNAHIVKQEHTYCLYSKLNLNVLKVLKEEGYIREYNSENYDNNKQHRSNFECVLLDARLFSHSSTIHLAD